MSTTSAWAVSVDGATPVIDEATHWRSTPKGLQLVEHVPAVVALLPYCQLQLAVHVVMFAVDFQTSACSGGLPLVVLARLHQYSEFWESVFRQSSPLLLSGDWMLVQVAPGRSSGRSGARSGWWRTARRCCPR